MTQLRTFIHRSHAGFLALAMAAATFIAIPARAHDGMEDVTGTVQSIKDNTVAVKTTKGATVSIKLDGKTEYTRGRAEAKQADVKVGERVVIHAMEMNEVLTAHLVELPAAAAKAKK